jgi:hypothetical protein
MHALKRTRAHTHTRTLAHIDIAHNQTYADSFTRTHYGVALEIGNWRRVIIHIVVKARGSTYWNQ